MFSVTVAAYRKRLILSVGLFCLPGTAFGMNDFFGFGVPEHETKFIPSGLAKKTLRKPSLGVPTRESFRSHPTNRPTPLFLQSTSQSNSVPIHQQAQTSIINDNVALEMSKTEKGRPYKPPTRPFQSQTFNSYSTPKRKAIPLFLQEKTHQDSLSESGQGKQNTKIESSVIQQDQTLTTHSRREPFNKRSNSSCSQIINPPRSRQVDQCSTVGEPLQKQNAVSKDRPRSIVVPARVSIQRSQIIHGSLSILLNSKAEILNKYIPARFYVLENFRAPVGGFVTPLESLALKFYIKMTEARCIRLMDMDPDLDQERNKIKPGELALFCDETHALCCQIAGDKKFKIVKSDDPTVLSYPADSFDRILEALKPQEEHNTTAGIRRYRTALQQEEEVQRALLNVKEDWGPETLATWDSERLFQYTTLCGYSLKAKGIKPWPKITEEKIKKINPEELLDQFWRLDKSWNYSFAKNLGSTDHLVKISQDTLELITASATFLIETIKNMIAEEEIKKSKAEPLIKQLSQTLRYCCPELSRRDSHNEEYHYHSAKYLTGADYYEEAWAHISQCMPYIQNIYPDDEEIKWLKWLQNKHVTAVVKKKLSSEIEEKVFRETQGKNYFEIAAFTQIINMSGNKNDIYEGSKGNLSSVGKPDLDAVFYYLESLKNLYGINGLFPALENISKINKSSPDILFHVACKAYDGAKDDKKNTNRLLDISQACLVTLSEKKSKLQYDCEGIIENVIRSTNFPKTQLRDSILEESHNLILQRASILINMGQMVWNPNKENNVLKDLYLSIANLLYYAEFSTGKVVAKEVCLKWDSKIIESVIEGSIRSGSPVPNISLENKIINEFCNELIDRKHETPIYLPVFAYLKKREMWVTAFKLTQLTTTLIPETSRTEFDKLKQEIEEPYKTVQRHKRVLGEAFMTMIEMIVDQKNISEKQVINWTDSCHLITKDQFGKLQSNVSKLVEKKYNYISSLKEGSFNFLTLEPKEYMEKFYENFGLSVPPQEWLPDNYLDLGETPQTELGSFAQISQDSPKTTNLNVLEVKKLEEELEEKINQKIRLAIRTGHERGATIEVLAAMFDLQEEQIKQILK